MDGDTSLPTPIIGATYVPPGLATTPGAPRPVKLRQTYSRDAFRSCSKLKYRKGY